VVGSAVAQYAGKHLHEYLTNQDAYKEGHIEEAIKKGFLELDEEMQTNETIKQLRAGTTVISILIKDNILYCVSIDVI
jgi:protein phosphatase 2C family protein 2/3